MNPWGYDIKEVYPFELKDKTIVDAYYHGKNVLILVFSDGSKKRIVAEANEVFIKKQI